MNGKSTKRNKPHPSDDLRPEYDLAELRVRRLGPKRKSFAGSIVKLESDVANFFPDAESVNEALRFLIRVSRESKRSATSPRG
ncbi:MAG: hypothetical protein FJY92_12470 [Candidatus Hydrogenedentes bacterium]|nr:hypothetical protein [Candidatus Hydrogenedentota bacterium]